MATQPIKQELVLLEVQILAAEAAAVEMDHLLVVLVVQALLLCVTNSSRRIIWHTN
jgi:hypothetical protein